MSDETPDMRYGRLLESADISGIAAQRSFDVTRELLESGEWKTVGGGFDDPSSFIRSIPFGVLNPPDELRKAFELTAFEHGASKRAIADSAGVDEKTVRNDLRPDADQSALEFGEPINAQATEPSSHVDADYSAPDDELPASQDQADEILSHFDAEPVWSGEESGMRTRLAAGETVVVSMRGAHANLIVWAQQRDLYVRIDRNSAWGNPFEIPGDGDRATVIASYAEHYLPRKPSLLSKIDTLRGKALGCWCAPEPCHGDVLKARAEA